MAKKAKEHTVKATSDPANSEGASSTTGTPTAAPAPRAAAPQRPGAQSASTSARSNIGESPRSKAKAPKSRASAGSSMSGLDAAHAVLASAKAPMSVQAITKAIFEAKLWTTEGKTPHATIAAAILREIQDKGAASRFTKTAPGLFAARATSKNGAKATASAAKPTRVASSRRGSTRSE